MKKWESVIQLLLVKIDVLIYTQVREILSNPRFQQLESSWRQLSQLVFDTSPSDNVKIRVINFSWREISKDLENASDFDDSYLFKLIYTNEYDMPGGEPYGLLLGGYAIDPSRKDLSVLRLIGQIAAAAFSPFIVSVTPAFFDLESFSGLQTPINLKRTFSQEKFNAFKMLRSEYDMRFVGLILPRVLVKRKAGRNENNYDSRLGFTAIDDSFVWGNPCFAFAIVAINAFKSSGWFASIQGVSDAENSHAILKNLPSANLTDDDTMLLNTPSTDICISEQFEKELNSLGFISLCECRYTGHYAFFSSPSVYGILNKDTYTEESNNSPSSSMLNYVMCVSRFAHYIKIIAREKIGSYKTIEAYERELYNWVLQYTANSTDMSAELMAKHPLRSASVTIRERKQSPGSYYMIIRLQPHFQFEWISGSIELITDIKNV